MERDEDGEEDAFISVTEGRAGEELERFGGVVDDVGDDVDEVGEVDTIGDAADATRANGAEDGDGDNDDDEEEEFAKETLNRDRSRSAE